MKEINFDVLTSSSSSVVMNSVSSEERLSFVVSALKSKGSVQAMVSVISLSSGLLALTTCVSSTVE